MQLRNWGQVNSRLFLGDTTAPPTVFFFRNNRFLFKIYIFKKANLLRIATSYKNGQQNEAFYVLTTIHKKNQTVPLFLLVESASRGCVKSFAYDK